MLKQTPLIVIVFLLSSRYVLSQEDYYVMDNDTVFCDDLSYWHSAQGKLITLEYIDSAGVPVAIRGKDNLSNVHTLRMNGHVLEKIPLTPKKGNKYTRFTKRVMNGKLKVYANHNGADLGIRVNGQYEPQGQYRFIIQLPDGSFYTINNKKNMEEVIKPFLQECQEFMDKYEGEFRTQESLFLKTVELYNSVCE